MIVRTLRLFVGLVVLQASAAAPASAVGTAARVEAAGLRASPALAKISSHLLQARSTGRRGVVTPLHPDLLRLDVPRERAYIDIRATAVAGATLERLRQLGMRIDGHSARFARIWGWAPLEALEEMAALPEISTIHPVYKPLRQVGAVTSEGDVSVRADQARSTYGVDGSGLRIGVVSDSLHATAAVGGTTTPGANCGLPASPVVVLEDSNPQDTLDLPPTIDVLDNCDSGAFCFDLTDEGAAMAELAFDLAPGVEILFHSGFVSEADFAEGVVQLRTCGAQVLVDDVQYVEEPMFQDGVIAQAAQEAFDNGVPYYSAAGNQATFGVDTFYSDSNPATDDEAGVPSGDDLHDFGGGDRFGAITLPAGSGVQVVLQWNDPFSGLLGPGASSDLDLHLYDAPDPTATRLSSSTNVQGCGAGGEPFGDPLEVTQFLNSSGSERTIYLAIEHFCGAEDEHLRIAVFPVADSFPGDYVFEAGIFEDAQIYGHAAAFGVDSVAAVDFQEIDSDGSAQPPSGVVNVEPFSSLGGELTLYFDDSGTPLGTPESRFKPDIAAPDGTSTTLFGAFFGTSAAAPHAAAVAALMLEADTALNAADVRTLLHASAVDIESVGFDALSGAGRIDALDAVELAVASASLVVAPMALVFETLVATTSATAIVTLSNPHLGPESVTVSSITSSDPALFALDVNGGSNPCGSSTPTLPPASSCTISVTLQPSAPGSFAETLTIQSNLPQIDVQLSGEAVEPCVEPLTITLTGTISSAEMHEACETIFLGPGLTVEADLILRAGVEVQGLDSISIAGDLAVEIDPLLIPVP